VKDVHVELGDKVQAGQLLAKIHSREVGTAKLQLARARMDVEAARKENEWYSAIDANTRDLLNALQEGTTIVAIEEAFAGRPIGSYRDQLLSAAARRQRAQADYKRIHELGDRSVIPGKEVIRAESEVRSANASYGALIEQIRFEANRELVVSQRELSQAEATLATSQAQLRIFGYTQEEIERLSPLDTANDVADYPLRSPLAGTIIEKHLVSAEHVEVGTQLVEVADLTTLWLRADIFEKDLGKVIGLEGKPVEFWSPSYAGRRFKATVFSLGMIVDDTTRAARLLAETENSDGLLRPGMFVEIELQGDSDPNVVQVPGEAVQHHAGEDFVFVGQGTGVFEKRNVVVGRTTPDRTEIISGLDEGEAIVIRGGFALKSEMLSELMAEE
jgi:RND family efflux transporter MFP subunit